MVNIPISDVLVLLIPVILWIVGIVTRLPITILFAGFGFIAVGVYFLNSSIPQPFAIGYGILGIFVVIGTLYTLK